MSEGSLKDILYNYITYIYIYIQRERERYRILYIAASYSSIRDILTHNSYFIDLLKDFMGILEAFHGGLIGFHR